MSRRIRNRRRFTLISAVAPVLAVAALARGGGNWDGEGQTTPVRDWINPLNWDFNSSPVPPIDPVVFGTNGDGDVDLNGGFHSMPSLTFGDWTSYRLFNGTISLTGASPTITVNAEVPGGVNGSAHFIDGTRIDADLDFSGLPVSVYFAHPDFSPLYLGGTISGIADVTFSRVAGGAGGRQVHFANPNGAYTGNVYLTEGIVLHLNDAGRPGTGTINFNQGQVDIRSDTGPQIVANPVSSINGSFFAEHNYTVMPMPIYAPGTTHTIGPVTLDNPNNVLVPGFGANDASINFNANNGYNFFSPLLVLTNTQPLIPPPIPAGNRYVRVQNGVRRDGWEGSVRLTTPNRLHEQVVTTTFGGLTDWDPIGLVGLPLIKYGTGVMALDGDNTAYGPGIGSAGAKNVAEGVMRFNNPLAYGGAPGFPAAVTVYDVVFGAPVSAGMGLGYDPGPFAPPLPANLNTTGLLPGQSGALDVDTPIYTTPFAPLIMVPTMPFPTPTAVRLGSSGVGTISPGTPVAPYDDIAAATSTWYLGGGGGTLTMAGAWGPAMFPGATVEMGTTGNLLPGRVNITAGSPLPFGPPLGPVNIRAGTLDASPVGVLAASAGTSLGAYSTTLDVAGVYGGAPAATPFNGPGQLLLDAGTQAGGVYFYGPGPFGAAGVTLDGGAIGWAPTLGPAPAIVPVFGIPGAYGATVASTLYTSAGAPAPALATNILHFGGENSNGGAPGVPITIVPLFAIGNNGLVRVALLKSGADSILDLTAVPGHPHTGGTGILGGEVLVNAGPQLGPAGPAGGAVVIGDGGNLHVVGPGPGIGFGQILRVANAPGAARASIVTVDPGITAAFTLMPFEAASIGSVLEKRGLGTLSLTRGGAGFLYPSTAANTWGIKATEGIVNLNQLPGVTTVANGSAIFQGGTLNLVAPPVAIPAATLYHSNYGFGGLTTYAMTGSFLNIGLVGPGAFFRVTGGQTSNLMGFLSVTMGATSVFKVAGDASATDTRGTGIVDFNSGFVQFTPSGGGRILWPRDGGFTMNLNGTAFAGCADTTFNGNLLLSSATIDGATVDNTPTASADTWTIGGTGSTTWIGTTIKGRTEAVPGAGGPYASGIVNLNRNLGAPVSIAAGALLQIDYGTLNAGGSADPFTDTSTAAHISVINNASFNITQGLKHVLSIVGIGSTSVSAGAILDVGSSGPVTQGSFTVAGSADVGDVNVAGTTSVSGTLTSHYVRGGTLSISGGTVTIKPNGGPAGTSRVNSLLIPSGKLDLKNNKLIVVGGTLGTWNGSAYTGLTGLVRSGRNTGAVLTSWNGSGIVTSQSSALSPNSLTSLAIATADQIGRVGNTFGGFTAASGDVLVMYTYGGDANLSGYIDADDYFQIDSHYGKTAGSDLGYFNGDFTYNGLIDGDDYFIIDQNFSGQGAPFSSGAPALGGVSAVPEPAGLGLAVVATMALSRRRVRRQR